MKSSRLLPTAFVVGAVCWLSGFIWFMNVTGSRPTIVPLGHADGIVAFTGGARRVETALHLLVCGHADKLLLSGIGGGTELTTLGHLARIDTGHFADRITLGRYATSTHGNAVETAAWAKQNHIGTLIVVTAAYHMPRALTELRRALPDAYLIPLAIQPRNAGEGPGLILEADEFTKYLVSVSGLSTWLPRRDNGSRSRLSPDLIG